MMDPADCRPEDECVCLDGPTADLNNDMLLKGEECLVRSKLGTTPPPLPRAPWWQDTWVIATGTFAIGLLAGTLAARD